MKRSVAIIAGQLAVGGAERQLYLWLANLDRARFEPVVVTLHPDENDFWEGPIEALGIPIIRVSRRHNRMARLLEITRCLRPYQPELIHAWHLFASPYAGATARLLGAKGSLGSHRGSYEFFRESVLNARLTFFLTSGIVVNSRSTGQALAESYYKSSRERIHVIPNAVEDRVERRELTRAVLAHSWGLSTDDVWIGSMGRLEELKRFDLLLEAVARLRKREPRVRLLLVGSGPKLDDLNRQAETLGIRDITVFTGADPDARNWLSALDVFCFPSTDEGLPNVIMEAAVAALPIVAWDRPFLQELLVNGSSGLLVETGNIPALEEGLLRVIRDPQLARRLGGTAREQILVNFGLNRFVNRMTDTYDGVFCPRRVLAAA
jgi:glycosyltransferase involved in cell wall biosynthesis